MRLLDKIKELSPKMSLTKLVFIMMWLMEIIKIYQEEQLQIKYYVIKHLILQKIQNMIDIDSE